MMHPPPRVRGGMAVFKAAALVALVALLFAQVCDARRPNAQQLQQAYSCLLDYDRLEAFLAEPPPTALSHPALPPSSGSKPASSSSSSKPAPASAGAPIANGVGPNAGFSPSPDAAVRVTVTNRCSTTVWPALLTKADVPRPAKQGFRLDPGASETLSLSPNWQGRFWGRTNCSFNEAGTGPKGGKGFDGSNAACMTGDCNGQLDCRVSGLVPVTLVEMMMNGGAQKRQIFYDISLVDGYNVPIGVSFIPHPGAPIAPRLFSPSCIATAGWLEPPSTANASAGLWETSVTNDELQDWCPWNLQRFPPTRPAGGVFHYPDTSGLQHPAFDPCLSDCTKTNDARACCRPPFDTTAKCPQTASARLFKRVCPDAYSYAKDDARSTFVLQRGYGGFSIDFCPAGRSTDIIATAHGKSQFAAEGGFVSNADVDRAYYAAKGWQ